MRITYRVCDVDKCEITVLVKYFGGFMAITLNWGSERVIQIGSAYFSNQRRVRSLNGVLSYGYGLSGVAGETDAIVMNKEDRDLHNLPVE